MTTIRLSDRLELRADAESHLIRTLILAESHLIRTLILDGEHAGIVYASAESALVALANPPRYDLPPGVEPGYILKAGNPLPVGWEGQTSSARGGWLETSFPNEGIPWDPHKDRLVRPTVANPLQPLPAHTFRLPDGELACYRRDAAKLREAGATLRYTDTRTRCTFARQDVERSSQVLLVEFPAPPKTERVPWWEAVGRKHQVWGPILSVSADGDGAQIETATHSLPADADGTVEVLVDGAR